MDTVQDFEDMLALLHRHQVRYLIIGGMAFIYHAKPRFTKDMDLWIERTKENIERTNRALADFGSPTLFSPTEPTQILQIGVAPDRIDLIVDVDAVNFEAAWERRIRSHYGQSEALWIDLDNLIEMKSRIDSPRHREDVRVLLEVRRLREGADS